MLSFRAKKTLTNPGGARFDLDVAFVAGDGFTVLMGPSGSGKSTILQLISGILTPDEGRIVLESTVYFDSAGTNLPIQQRRVGFVFQDYALFPHLTVEQNVAYGIDGTSRKERLARADEMLDLFHIKHTRGRRPVEMSGGEQQRAALARALASNPAIVLLDEPLSAVDVETRSKLLDEIETVQARTGIPFIYVTHNHDEASRLAADRIELAAGRVKDS